MALVSADPFSGEAVARALENHLQEAVDEARRGLFGLRS